MVNWPLLVARLRGGAPPGAPNAGSVWLALGLVVTCVVAPACGDVNAALQRQADARRLAADVHVQFEKAAGATDRAVMADTDETSAAFAREAEQATAIVNTDVQNLTALLQQLGYADETRLVQQFVAQFATYRELDRRILDLAVQNTNLKAQRLSFGAASDAADALKNALDALTPANPTTQGWSVAALAARTVADVREIQALQAPHIADPDDQNMGRIEARMSKAEGDARSSLASLAPLVTAASRAHLAAASSALDQFMGLNTQIIGLSRQNTNVRSLALTLDRKRALTAPCDDTLRALEAALAKRGYTSGR